MKRFSRALLVVLFVAGFAATALITDFRAFSHGENSSKTAFGATDYERATLDNLVPLQKQAFKFAVSAPVSGFAPGQPETNKTSRKIERRQSEEIAREIKNEKSVRAAAPNAKHDEDAAIARMNAEQMPAPELTFDGLSSRDTAAAFGFRAVPPDPTGDVGPNHYVQATNLLVRVFDKSGAPLTPGFKLSQVYANLNTACARRDDGDPIVLHDQLADRWLLSSFCTAQPPFRQIVAVSETSDPTGRYFVYEFVMPNNKLNDYTKFGVWRSAFLMTTDQFVGSDFAGTGAFAFEREKMLRGDAAASYIYYDLASPTTIRLGGMLPADFDGSNPPPPGAPGIFVSYTANEYGNEQTDAIKLFEFRPNFQNPRSSTFVERPESPLPVAAFDPTSNPDRTDIRQPAPGDLLDAQSDRLMYRVAYRNFGDAESLVFNQTVRASGAGEEYRAGVRLYELRRSNQNSDFQVNTQTTAAFDNLSRWMGSAAQDRAGNLAVGYSAANAAKAPAIAYTGRAAADAPNTLRGEATLHNGTGVQTAFGFRWGDYSTLGVDPADDCTFWYTNEYYSAESQAESPFGWLTRIGKFRFPDCQSQLLAALSGVVRNAANNQPVQNAVIQTDDGFSRQTDANGNYNFRFPPSVRTITVSATGFRTQTATIDASGTLVKDFQLQPIAVLRSEAIEIAAESCARDAAIEPGETATINLPIRNTGALSTANLTATLVAANGVTNPSQPQNYGALAANQVATRQFTFTAANNLACGAELVLTFALRDAAEDLGAITVRLNAGKEKIRLRQRFDNAATGKIPFGWTSAASGAQTVWQTVRERSNSYPHAGFSATAFQAGVNELASPAFPITSRAAVLRFRNKYDLESTFLRNKLYDGGVLEIKIGAAAWTDITAANGEFVSGGYDGVLDGCCQNPLAGRRAWSGKSGIEQEAQFVATEIVLPAAAENQTVQLRWRVGTDVGGRRVGQWIDDVTVSDGFVCSCAN